MAGAPELGSKFSLFKAKWHDLGFAAYAGTKNKAEYMVPQKEAAMQAIAGDWQRFLLKQCDSILVFPVLDRLAKKKALA